MQTIADKENKEQAISHKEENGKLTAYFKVLADYDEEECILQT
jgi:hypothetical protein